MTFNLWYHDGSGHGYPALETDRRIERVSVTTNGSVHMEDRLFRDLLVASAKAVKKAGITAGWTPFLDVPEGTPNEKGTCSHIQWQPGTEQHTRMVLGDLEGEELLARADEHGISAKRVGEVLGV